MVIGGVDQSTSAKLRISLKRKLDESARIVKHTKLVTDRDANGKDGITFKSSTQQKAAQSSDSDDNLSLASLKLKFASSISNPNEPSVSVLAIQRPSTSLQLDRNHQLRKELPAFARACDRHRVSDRSAAAIATAVLHDFGLISHVDSSNVIDKSKVRRERKKNRSKLICQVKEYKDVTSLYFDGRKDKTLINVKKEKKYHRQVIVEEHLSLVAEPNSIFLGHITPKGGSAKFISQSMSQFIALKYIVVKKLLAIGCDGTNVNTGRTGGTIRLLEEYCNKPLQCCNCFADGSGKGTWSGC